jgi:hypothetical protein
MDPSVGKIIETLGNVGVLGGVLLWFMLRLEKKLESLDRSLSELAKVIAGIER